MTGKYYSMLGFRSHPSHIPLEADTIAELFHRAGLHTVVWNVNGLLARKQKEGFDQGVDTWHNLLARRDRPLSIEEVIRFIERDRGEQVPDFCYVHLMDVHEPYAPPSPWDRMWASQVNSSRVWNGEFRDACGKHIISNLPYYAESVTPGEIQLITALYDGAIRYVDAHVAALLKALRYEPEKDLLIFSADHGEQLFEHGFKGHGYMVYPMECHVPLIIQYQDFPPAVIDPPVSLLDLFPTLCALYGWQLPADLPGKNLVPVLEGKQALPSSRAVIVEQPYWTGIFAAPEAAVIQGKYWYRFSAGVHLFRPWNPSPWEEGLFDFHKDPFCLKDLLTQQRPRADKMQTMLIQAIPRYSAYPLNKMKLSHEPVSGDNVLRLEITRNAEKKLKQQEKQLVLSCNTDCVYTATVQRKIYRLDVRLRILSGCVHLSCEQPDRHYPVIWSYTCSAENVQKVNPAGEITLRCWLHLFPGKIRFLVRLDTGAEIVLSALTLRPSNIPVFPLVSLEGKPLSESAIRIENKDAPKLSPDGKRRLEALGYL